MAKMRAIDAAVRVLEKEGVTCAFGVPGAAINPLYSALKKRGSINHILARHVEGASHMAEGYTRAKAGNIGVCIGTSGPAGTDMITGLYSAIADSIPILCVTGQAPRARLYKEDFQAVDIEAIAKPVTCPRIHHVHVVSDTDAEGSRQHRHIGHKPVHPAPGQGAHGAECSPRPWSNAPMDPPRIVHSCSAWTSFSTPCRAIRAEGGYWRGAGRPPVPATPDDAAAPSRISAPPTIRPTWLPSSVTRTWIRWTA